MNIKIAFTCLTIIFALQIFAFGQTADGFIANAKAAIEKNDYESALRDLNAVLAKSPNHEAALTQRSRVFVRQGKYAEALADSQKVLAKNLQNYEALNVRGVVKRNFNKDYQGALEDFTQALAVKPDFYFAFNNRAITFASMGKTAEALAEFDKAIQLEPNNPTGYAQKANILTNTGKYKEAITLYDKAISVDGKNDSLYASRGYWIFRNALAEDKDATTLIKNDAEMALKLNPNSSLGYALRGFSRFLEKDIDGAMLDAEKCVQINPKNFLGYMLRGFVKRDKKEFDASFEEFDQALKIAPNDKWVNDMRVNALGKSPTALAKAVEAGKQKVAANMWDFKAYDELNDAFDRFDRNGEQKLAKIYWETLLSENPKNICAIRFLGEYKGGNYFRDMINFLDDGLNKFDGKNGAECASEIAFRIGRELNSRNNFAEAEKYLAKAAELNPKNKKAQAWKNDITEKENAERENREFDAKSSPISQNSQPSVSRNSNSNKTLPPDPQKVAAAVREYETVHASIETDLREFEQAAKKYSSAGLYRQYYKGTYDRLIAIQRRMIGKIDALIEKHGKVLPAELKDHILGDKQKIIETNIPSPWQ